MDNYSKNIMRIISDIPTEKYLEQDLPEGQTMAEFTSVNELIDKCLGDSLIGLE